MEATTAYAYAALFMLACGAFNYIVISPLQTAIKELKAVLAELREDVRTQEKSYHALDVRLTQVESSAKSAHHRLDTLERAGHEKNIL